MNEFLSDIVNILHHWMDMDDARVAAEQIIAVLPHDAGVNPWQAAVDEARVVAHLGIAKDGVSRAEAIRQLGELLDWYVAVACDPAVNGGFVLTPQQPAPESHNYDEGGECRSCGVLAELAERPCPRQQPIAMVGDELTQLRGRLEFLSKQYGPVSGVGAGIDRAIRELDALTPAAQRKSKP